MRVVVEGVLRRLRVLPPSSDGEVLRRSAVDYLRRAHGWRYSRPTPYERNELMKRVLTLHAEVGELERKITASRPTEGGVQQG
jgi:hypothetical protein